MGKIKKGRLAVKSNGESQTIGVLAFYTFGAVAVPKAEVERYWNEKAAVLPQYTRPNFPSKGDAAMKTCSDENVGIYDAMDESAILEFEKQSGQRLRTQYVSMPVKNAKNAEYVLARRIWVLGKDGKNGEEITPTQPNLARLRYNNQSDRIDVIAFPQYEKSGIIAVIDRVVNAEFERQKDIVDSVRHRQAIYRLIEAAGGVTYGFQQGVSFVPNDGLPMLEAFYDYIVDVASKYSVSRSHPVDIMVTDVIDGEREKENIAKSVAKQVNDQYEKLLTDTQNYLRKQSDKVVSDKEEEKTLALLNDRLAEIGRIGLLKDKYEALLGKTIAVEQMQMNPPENLSGRASALFMAMVERVNNERTEAKEYAKTAPIESARAKAATKPVEVMPKGTIKRGKAAAVQVVERQKKKSLADAMASAPSPRVAALTKTAAAQAEAMGEAKSPRGKGKTPKTSSSTVEA